MTIKARIITLVAGVTLGTGGAQAAIIANNASVAATPSAFDPSFGMLQISTGVQPFSATFTNLFSGSVTQEVRQESLLANPLGGLTFIYQISNDATSQTSIKRLVGGNFNGFATDVSIYGPGQGALTFDRDASGINIGADFTVPTHGLDAGETSSLLVVRTNASSYTNGFISIIDGGSATVGGYAPVPEPGAIALIGIATYALLGRRRQSA